MATFHSGRYECQWEDVEFDLKEHNLLLKIRAEKREGQAKLDKKEKEILEKWAKEKEAGRISIDTVEELTPIEAPLNTNMWKVEIKEGDKVEREKS
jgi:urea carboxylase